MEEALVKRIMPHSLEAEQSVIGSMIMDRDAILTASEQLVKDDFYHQQYGILFETITELFNSGSPVDLITLQNRLREKCAAGDQQSGIRRGSGHCRSDICKYQILCGYCKGKSSFTKTDQDQRADCRHLLSG